MYAYQIFFFSKFLTRRRLKLQFMYVNVYCLQGHFFVSGFRHFSTFDQRAFDYVSDCASTHLLAADMKTGNFSVSLTYADPTKRGDMNSINVILGENNIVISGDYSVSMGGKKQQLPFNIDQVRIYPIIFSHLNQRVLAFSSFW